ncbi:MAG: phosphotriesterase-related protein [Candidatus Obscuribacterales bacterium]|nr:phosphotriesterase-related protein [Candidatus Obscuribacterales bacterium]
MANSDLMTVLGPVASSQLGITLPHEHVFLDLSCLWHQPKDSTRELIVDAPVCMEMRGLLHCDPYNSRDNLLLQDRELAVRELNRFKELGGGTLLDLSTRSIGPYPEKLAEVAQATGLNIIAGTGFYTQRAHPEMIKDATVIQIADEMIRDLTEGFAGTKIKAGVIGEIGSSSPIHPDEIKVLQASAIAQVETGAAINVHLAIFAQEGHQVLDILEGAGADLSRVALSHLDELPDHSYRESLAKRSCYIEFDCFGSEVYFDEDNLREPSDAERIEALLRLIDAGFEKQILLSQDVCTKMQLRNYGGMGYDHLLRTIVPRLLKRGVSQALINTMLIENPAHLLTPA